MPVRLATHAQHPEVLELRPEQPLAAGQAYELQIRPGFTDLWGVVYDNDLLVHAFVL